MLRQVMVGSRHIHRCTLSAQQNDNNYNNDFDSFQLSPASTSHRILNYTESFGQSQPSTVFNEQQVRDDLNKLAGGKVELDKDEETGIATVTLCNPQKANAITGSMMVQLADIVQDLEQWRNGKAVILSGLEEGKHFCSGMDLDTANSLDEPRAGAMMCIFMQNTLSRLQRLQLISVAAISGKAVGAGAELTTACDFRLMAEGAQIWFIQSHMGVTPGLGGGARLVGITGRRVALKILSGGVGLKGDDAFKIGLADHLLPTNVNVIKYTKDWMDTYTFAAADVVQSIKGVVTAAAELPLDDALSREKDIFASLWGGPSQKAAFAKAAEDIKE